MKTESCWRFQLLRNCAKCQRRFPSAPSTLGNIRKTFAPPRSHRFMEDAISRQRRWRGRGRGGGEVLLPHSSFPVFPFPSLSSHSSPPSHLLSLPFLLPSPLAIILLSRTSAPTPQPSPPLPIRRPFASLCALLDLKPLLFSAVHAHTEFSLFFHVFPFPFFLFKLFVVSRW